MCLSWGLVLVILIILLIVYNYTLGDEAFMGTYALQGRGVHLAYEGMAGAPSGCPCRYFK